MPKADPKILLQAFGLPPEKAVAFFEAKGYKITFDWHEMRDSAHAKTFTVAKAMTLDILQDFNGMCRKALSEGITLKKFQDELEPRLRAKGWWGKKEVVAPDGETRTVQLGSPWRLRTIYQTNLQTAYMAGRYKSMMASVRTRPFWQYIAVMDAKTRPEHRELHGKIFRFDDPFWNHFYPPNGFNCRCRVSNLSEREIERDGLKVSSSEGLLTERDEVDRETGRPYQTVSYKDPDSQRALGIQPDEGWNYNPGKAAAQLDEIAAEKARQAEPELRNRFQDEMAESAEARQQAFKSWAKEVIERGQERGETVPVGWLDSDVTEFMREKKGVEPETVVITMNDHGVLHSRRPQKQGRPLSDDEFMQIPTILANPTQIFFDDQDVHGLPSLLYVVNSGELEIKVVVRVNFKRKGKVFNMFITTGKVEAEDLLHPRYVLIKAKKK